MRTVRPPADDATRLTATGVRVGLWLLGLFAIALALRLTNLTLKPAWMDEVSTVLFSLGNSSRMIPLNEVISLDQLLRPLQISPEATVWDSATYLLQENNHPPAYFMLAHGWMDMWHWLFPRADGYASLWGARALSALLGALAVPGIYGLAQVGFQAEKAKKSTESRRIGLLCAALMAVSPFAIFLAQEARHYTLAILMVMGSLACFIKAFRFLKRQALLPWPWVLGWVGVNGLGIAVHYFCGITLLSEGLVLLTLLLAQCRREGSRWRRGPWVRIYVAAAGTLVGGLLWLPVLLHFYGSPQSSYLRSGPSSWKYWVDPIAQSVAGWLYRILSPVTNGYSWQAVTAIVVSTSLLLLVYTPWLLANLRRALGWQLAQPTLRPGLLAIISFFVAANAVSLLICYGLGFDITRGHRYSFVYFPSLLLLVGAGLGPFWLGPRSPSKSPSLDLPSLNGATAKNPRDRFGSVKLPLLPQKISGRAFVITVLAVGFFGAQVIVQGYTSLKFYKPDRFINFVRAESSHPVVIGTETTLEGQPVVVGIEIMSAAWEIQRQLAGASRSPSTPGAAWVKPPQFVIAENNSAENRNAIDQLKQSLAAVPRPFDLWLLNFGPDLSEQGCRQPEQAVGTKGSFSYTRYLCESSK